MYRVLLFSEVAREGETRRRGELRAKTYVQAVVVDCGANEASLSAGVWARTRTRTVKHSCTHKRSSKGDTQTIRTVVKGRLWLRTPSDGK